jgi:hypothetical protein
VKNHLKFAGLVAVILGLAAASYVVAFQDSRSGPNHVKGNMDGYQENPSISTTGQGTVDLRIDEDGQTIEFEVNYSGLEGTALVSHIHFSRERVNGPVVVFFCGGGGKGPCPLEGTVTGTITASDIPNPATPAPGSAAANGLNTFEELVRAIRAGATYANVHSTKWPGGEIRGQIRVADER